MSLEEQLKIEMAKATPKEIDPKSAEPAALPAPETRAMVQINPDTGELIETDLEVGDVKVSNFLDYDFDVLEECLEISLEPVYWSCETAGTRSVGYYAGPISFFKNRNGEKLELTGFAWITKSGVLFVSGAATPDRFAKVPVNAPISVTYLGKTSTKDGKNEFKDYKVSLLTLPNK